MLKPVFVKGHLTFRIDQDEFEFIHRSISVFGVTGLPWGKLSAKSHFGREVTASIRIPGPPVLALTTRGYIMREYTAVGEHMGIKFRLDDKSTAALSAHIEKHGNYPTDYLRKYPRIPADPRIQTFPLRVLAVAQADKPEKADPKAPPAPAPAPPASPLIMEVGNLSPSGILLHTENQAVLSIHPGTRLNLTLDPRGWFPVQIHAQGQTCRIVDELSPDSGNLIRYMGIKFSKMDDVNRTAFLDLLRDILDRIKQRT